MVTKRVKDALNKAYGNGSSEALAAIRDFERIERIIRKAKKLAVIKVEST